MAAKPHLTSENPTAGPSDGAKSRRRRSVPQRALDRLLAEGLRDAGDALRVVDLGGGTGGLAATLAASGHSVLVIDPSPDALAASARRAAERGLGDRLTGRQGDTTTLLDLVEPASVDLLLIHLVLGRIGETVDALRAIATALAPGGLLSVVIVQPYATMLKKAATGDFAGAAATLADADLLDRPALLCLLGEAGFSVEAQHGIGLVADQIGVAMAEDNAEAALQLELQCADNPAWLETATRFHVLARRE